ncbi:hypothetical protein K493DRAFT_384491 [Basidiobolus meristosporus CBS 931.73]|uniref:DUF202 domain-containing protein n=1 Tax=Basidiobolus meristosporus CBS 931.73 TaxID=1314790 RepID=A0A1Y1YYT3_9FUNG|nr:hypothetical protein K493DRAFT_384491 [Basidiobolus meristosporus CBS 931.73]|eukprot:ORY03109.1 hypothetical protein K493DRAFT_384491 [Basidiobolus meristosporus CBS 931.73]
MAEYPEIFNGLDDAELTEVRARERTFDGAYWRSALSVLGRGVVVLKVFTHEFYKMGMVYIALGIGLLLIAIHRRRSFYRDLDMNNGYKTSGKSVVLIGLMAISAYILMLIFLFEIIDHGS